MLTEKNVKDAAEKGPSAPASLFEKLSKEDALKGLGIASVIGITGLAFKTILEIVQNK